MGWGEPHGRSAELVAAATERRAAKALADTVVAFFDSPTTGRLESMRMALDGYRKVRR